MTDNTSRKSIVAPYIEGVINEKHSHGYSYESEELVLNEPENINLIPRGIELVCSAHCHGGQIRYYSLFKHKWCGVYSPSQGFLPRLTEGIHGNMIISRGLSNTARIPRICNPTELVNSGAFNDALDTWDCDCILVMNGEKIVEVER